MNNTAPSGIRLLIPFAILPLAIVIASVGVFMMFGKLAEQRKSAIEYLQEVRSGSSHRRWQAAYELAGILSRDSSSVDKALIEKEVLDVLNSSSASDPSLQKYLLIALGQVGSEKSVSELTARLDKSADSEIQIYAMLALARIGSPKAAPAIRKHLQSQDDGLKKTAAFALGYVGDRKDIPGLANLLQEEAADVRWNSALGLANLGDAAGKQELLVMLDPQKVKTETPNLKPFERDEITLSAINAVGKLELKESVPALEALAKGEVSVRLKTAASAILDQIQPR